MEFKLSNGLKTFEISPHLPLLRWRKLYLHKILSSINSQLKCLHSETFFYHSIQFDDLMQHGTATTASICCLCNEVLTSPPPLPLPRPRPLPDGRGATTSSVSLSSSPSLKQIAATYLIYKHKHFKLVSPCCCIWQKEIIHLCIQNGGINCHSKHMNTCTMNGTLVHQLIHKIFISTERWR